MVLFIVDVGVVCKNVRHTYRRLNKKNRSDASYNISFALGNAGGAPSNGAHEALIDVVRGLSGVKEKNNTILHIFFLFGSKIVVNAFFKNDRRCR
jgi:hypothetical protein